MDNLAKLETDIHSAEKKLYHQFVDTMVVNNALDRKLVSFQANKTERVARWCKFKEGFSSALIRYILNTVQFDGPTILDPFAGSGTTLFTATEFGLNSAGIEVLPNAIKIIEARNLVRTANHEQLCQGLTNFISRASWEESGPTKPYAHLAITKNAFPETTELALGRFRHEVDQLEDAHLRQLLSFAALCVLEEISYTRKDGQYLRWDSRAGRRGFGKRPFNKGVISTFSTAIKEKCAEITSDLAQDYMIGPGYSSEFERSQIELFEGSVLDVMPQLLTESFNGLITSPPYCNRYDYTRTYALELAMLETSEHDLKRLRQTMLSSTVENRDKCDLADKFNNVYTRAMDAFESQELLQLILSYLDICMRLGELNNNGIPRMVRNYFKELILVIFESSRILTPGAPFVMVNDNVRYQGISIPVDLILSDIARKAGFSVEMIWVLPKGKGNSSQQMGMHGRQETRKCVYVWKR